MSRRLGARPVTAVSLLVPSLAAVVALSGCAAGTDAVTSQSRTTTNSVGGAVGTITLRNVYVVGPAKAGGSTQIIAAFFNGGVESDTLTGVSSPVAAGGRPPAKDGLSAGGAAIFIADGTAPSLTGLKQDLLVGQAVPVTFTFAKAGVVTLDVPVEPPAPGAYVSPSVTPSASPSASASASPSASGSGSPTATTTATPASASPTP